MMDLPHRQHVVVLLLLLVEYLSSLALASSWEHISLRYGTWYTPPKTPKEAEENGYRLVNKICKMKTYHGFLYIKGGNNKSRLLFDLNDNLAGIQTAIPGNMYGFNSRNETIQLPPREVMPPILRSDDLDVQGIQMFTITAYFKHPKLICSPIAVNAHPGKGLYIQRGYDVEHDYEKIPMESKHLSSEWKKGSCRPQMGVHYFKKLSREMPCELLYPVFLMYNQDGLLGAFGWLFQGSPHFYAYDDELSWFRLTESTYPFIFDETMLPSCMFNPQFRVFGLSIYLRNKDTMICPIITQTPAPIPSTTTTTTTSAASYPFLTRRPQAPPPSPQLTSKPPSYDDTIILDEEIRKQSESAATVQRPDYWLVCLWAAVVGALVWLCIPDLVQVRTDT